jgi:hypothetical protein
MWLSHDAAQSGSIGDNGQSWVQTTVKGPGIVRFYWKVSSQLGGHYLEFFIDGVRQARISGTTDWQARSYTITGSGTHTRRGRCDAIGDGHSCRAGKIFSPGAKNSGFCIHIRASRIALGHRRGVVRKPSREGRALTQGNTPPSVSGDSTAWVWSAEGGPFRILSTRSRGLHVMKRAPSTVLCGPPGPVGTCESRAARRSAGPGVC